MNVLEKAIIYATEKHKGQIRKMAETPYILHPCEVAEIISTLTDSLETMAAGVLHDTIEDCGADPAEIRELFGPRVSALVQSESEDKLSERPPEETWMQRKEESLLMLKFTRDRDVKILWLSDKLSNIRSFWRGYLEYGNGVWDFFHQKDPKMHEWYYRTVAEYTKELSGTAAYTEYTELIEKLFGDK